MDTLAAECPHLAGYDPLSAAELRDPYPSFAKARRDAPVFYSSVSHTAGVGMWCLSRYDDVLAALRDTEAFSSAGQLPAALPPEPVRDRMPVYPWANTVLLLDDPDHKPARAILQAPFTPRGVKAREDRIRAVAEQLAADAAEAGRMDFVSEYAYPLSLATIGDVLGVPHARFDDLNRWITATFKLLGGGVTDPARVQEEADTVAELHEFIVALVEERRADPRDDYTSIMAHTRRDDGSLEPTSRMVHHVFSLLSAGFETTALSMALGMRALLANRAQWQLLLDNPELVPGAVEEMLRYRTLVKRLFRVTTRDVEVGSVTIPEGSLVALLLPSAHRDPGAFDDPDRFDIRRHPNNHVAFGRWKHFCVGATLARLELRVMLETMLTRFPSLRVVGGDEDAWRPDIRFDGLSRLDMEWGHS